MGSTALKEKRTAACSGRVEGPSGAEQEPPYCPTRELCDPLNKNGTAQLIALGIRYLGQLGVDL